MNETLDVIVIGLGAHGSSALYHLSKTGKKVMGIDRFTPPHSFGSSHGQSRIIRQAYHESPFYVPLVTAAYGMWEELEQITGKQLMIRTGGLLLGREDTVVVKGARLSAEMHGIPFEWLDAEELHRRFPVFRPTPETVGVWEKNAGVLFPEECIQAWLTAAAANQATIHCEETVVGIHPSVAGDRVEVITSKGRYTAGKVIVSAGAWVGSLLPELGLPLTIERQVVCWFRGKDGALGDRFGPAEMPIYIWEWQPGKMFYGFPDLGNGIKIGFHHAGRRIGPGELRQDVSEEEIDEISVIARTYLDLEPVIESSSVCMYTNTPDENFIIDHHPGCRNILVASACSGHGFKFSPVIGQLLSELATDQPVGFDLAPFALARLIG